MTRYGGTIDRGATSARFMMFARPREVLFSARPEHRRIYPRPGWVEHDAPGIRADVDRRWRPAMGAGRERLYRSWRKALARSRAWVDQAAE